MRLFRTVLAVIAAISISIVVVCAADFKVYPGAKLDEKLTKEANDFGAKSAATSKMAIPKATIYTTGEAYDKVYAFYKLAKSTRCLMFQEQRISFLRVKSLNHHFSRLF